MSKMNFASLVFIPMLFSLQRMHWERLDFALRFIIIGDFFWFFPQRWMVGDAHHLASYTGW